MKMVKSLLLGSAAGLVAVAGAQAADLPVKAKPVEYVKVCSLYGAGFYYMPGTDICIKIGGYVRAQLYANNSNSGTTNAFIGAAGWQDRGATHNNDVMYRSRVIASFDTRQQTEYGTLRTYMNLGWSVDGGAGQSVSPPLYANRAFIQLAGFTFGKAQSFFEIISNAAVSYFGQFGPDTGDGGQLLVAYTAQFGNGFSGTLSVEDPRRSGLANANARLAAAIGADAYGYGNRYANVNVPDIVANLRVDQAWGSAQIMGALHQVRADYYDTGNVGLGHPDDKWGWVIGAGAIINASFISPGDRFQFNVNYTEGALRYLTGVWGGANWNYANGSTAGVGLLADGVYTGTNAANGSGIELTKALLIQANYDHVWNQRWKTSIYGGYLDVKYGDNANLYLCGGLVLSGCDASWSGYQVGSRTQFNINSSTYMGFDVMYAKMQSSSLGNALNAAGQVAWNNPTSNRPGLHDIGDAEQLSFTFRIHRDFLP